MTPDDQKPTPANPIVPTTDNPLKILAPVANDTVQQTFHVDGLYNGGGTGVTVWVRLLYTDPAYNNQEGSASIPTTTSDYWTTQFSSVTVVAGRKYKITATVYKANGVDIQAYDEVFPITVDETPLVPIDEEGPTMEP